MNNLPELIQKYLRYCEGQRRLDSKTLKAYRIDLEQYCACFVDANISDITIPDIENYVTEMHDIYKPKTVKRKIASIKALYHYLEFQDLISVNPFNKIRIHFRTPQTLPKTIPLHTIQTLLPPCTGNTVGQPLPFGIRKLCVISPLSKSCSPPASEFPNCAA